MTFMEEDVLSYVLKMQDCAALYDYYVPILEIIRLQ